MPSHTQGISIKAKFHGSVNTVGK
uniref:Uncharacterized protein n=1 Tax=Rhizophora mucronata TaxID=61149 RepID=A0A2P2NX43_RHIMU